MDKTKSKTNLKQSVIKSIKEKVNHDYVEVVNRGSSAIYLALSKLKNGSNKIFAPVEGGWLTYKKYSKALGKDYIEINCNDAVIDLEDLRNKLVPGSIFIYHSLGGYFAENNLEEIYKICKKKDCLVIMDVCGSIGTKLCDGNYADVCIGSFGKWKLVDHGQGGFISFKNEVLFDTCKPFFSAFTFQGDYGDLLEKLDNVGERITLLLSKRKQIIEDLKQFKVLGAKNELGFVVVVKFDNDTDRLRILSYCTENGLEYTTCPREIRVMQEAISIEIKRL